MLPRRGVDVARIFREMDTDRSGNIDFSELLSVLYPMASAKDKAPRATRRASRR